MSIRATTSIRNSLRALVILLSVALLTGCAAMTSLPKPENPDEFALRVKAFRPNNAIALYIIEPDGALRFAGGRQALTDQTTWTGELTDEQARQLRSHLQQRNWFQTPPKSTKKDESYRTIIALRRINAQRKFTVYGENQAVQPILDVLEQAARRRHEPYLQRLPKPDSQP